MVSDPLSAAPDDFNPPPRQPNWYRKPLQRTPDEAPIAGVIAAIAQTYGFDPRLTRVATVLITLVFPITLLIYIVAWLVIPARPTPGESLETLITDRTRIPIYVALAVVALLGGTSFLGDRLAFGIFPFSVMLFVIALAVIALLGRRWLPFLLFPPLLLLGAAVLITEPQLSGGWGTRTISPTEVDRGSPGVSTNMAGGRLTIDLREIDRQSRDGHITPMELNAEMGFGTMLILLPPTSTVDLSAFLGSGVLRLDGEEITAGVRQRSSLRKPGPEVSTSEFVMNLRMGIGVIDIKR
jgi:phage shock protein PspC (stress-responsive transcriptional regulator)